MYYDLMITRGGPPFIVGLDDFQRWAAFRLACQKDGTQGQTGPGRPIVPLPWDKEIFLSRCPFVPGQGQKQKSWDSCFRTSFSCFRTSFSILERPILI